MKILYYDCFSGISGDMNLGAMIDLGVDPAFLSAELEKLALKGYELKISRDQRRGIWGTRAEVILEAGEAAAETGHVPHTAFRDIAALIEKSPLSPRVKKRSLDIFQIIAEAEAKIHGCLVGDVHFHEVGALDSIIDIVGAAICLESLDIDRVLSSPVQVGGGYVRCAHGLLPVPAPATAEILKGIPVRLGLVPFETTTPTGAAILAVTVARFVGSMDFIPRRVGYGIGQRDTEVPNVLRLFLGEMQEDLDGEDLEVTGAWLMECNIDDMNPEMYEGVMETLFEKGALDVFLTPLIMKKSRPAAKISVICDDRCRRELEEVLWRQTTTFGVRVNRIVKRMLKRDVSQTQTPYGPVSMKNGYLRGERIRRKPEYEDCKRLAKEHGVGVRTIYEALAAAEEPPPGPGA
ncbi:MAG: nickel pincer cofactor biosynthesis protein LarC [Deltaproteobacteria bacterium]|nr:nickel pincer cofactor biosynthesis protein LarC [Deltaproteobacteria bacterium]